MLEEGTSSLDSKQTMNVGVEAMVTDLAVGVDEDHDTDGCCTGGWGSG